MPAPAPAPAPALAETRLMSLDAYRGFVMLAMASGGLGFSGIVRNHPELLDRFDKTAFDRPWRMLWENLAFHFDHVAWHGCGFWDLIQPSFMFMVGVALPFSLARRTGAGQSPRERFGHVVVRSAVLVALGVFLSSNWSKLTNFTFVNVLSQIGLGYPFLYLLAGRRVWVQLLVAIAVLGGYAAWFALDRTSAEEERLVRQYVLEHKGPEKAAKEFDQFTGTAAAWNKHLNPAATSDRTFLNLFPRDKDENKEPVWHGRQFWINDGGYQTLNFVPSFVTMLFGLMTGQLLCSARTDRGKLLWMVGAGAACFAISMGLDTKMWPVSIPGCDWSFCPIVKRIWTPTWTLYSTGWTLWMLAAFYAVIDVAKVRAWSFPFVVVGMNSIAIYVAAQLLKPWLKNTARIHLTTLDQVWHDSVAPTIRPSWQNASIVSWLYDSMWSDFRVSVVVLAMLWLMCLWLYRQRIFIRI